MNALVAYDNSDDDSNISDSDEETAVSTPAIIILPKPKAQIPDEIEEQDEFLLLKVPENLKPKKEKIKITFPSLSEFKDDEKDELVKDKSFIKNPTAANRKCGLLGMLPKPKTSAPQVKLSALVAAASSSSNTSENKTASLKMIPDSVVNRHKPAPPKKPIMKANPVVAKEESDDDEEGVSYFNFGSEEKLPEVKQSEIDAMISKKVAKMDEISKKYDMEDQQANDLQYMVEAPVEEDTSGMDEKAMQALLGGNRAKRMKADSIQFIDLSAKEVLPDKEQWLRRAARGETEYVATGNIQEKGPNALAKRKHQISYLSMRAENNDQELEAMWAANRQTKRESKSKYGF